MLHCFSITSNERLHCNYVYNRIEKQRLPIAKIHEKANELPLVFVNVIICREDLCRLAEDICKGNHFP